MIIFDSLSLLLCYSSTYELSNWNCQVRGLSRIYRIARLYLYSILCISYTRIIYNVQWLDCIFLSNRLQHRLLEITATHPPLVSLVRVLRVSPTDMCSSLCCPIQELVCCSLNSNFSTLHQCVRIFSLVRFHSIMLIQMHSRIAHCVFSHLNPIQTDSHQLKFPENVSSIIIGNSNTLIRTNLSEQLITMPILSTDTYCTYVPIISSVISFC